MIRYSINVVLYHSLFARVRGLLGTTSEHQPICIYPCRSIHTVGMSYPIDVIFCDRHFRVVRDTRALMPGKRMTCKGAVCVIERPQSNEAWPSIGEQISVNVVRIK